MKKSGMPAMKGSKKINPFAKGGGFEAFKKTKGFAGGGLVNSDLKSMGRNLAKAKAQK